MTEPITKTVTVNYDDPQWQTIDGSRYAYVGDVKPKDYPIGGKGTKPIKYRLIEIDHDPLDDEVLAKMAELNCRQPDRAETETIIRGFTSDQLRAHPVIGLIGPAEERNGNLYRAYVRGHEYGVDLYWNWAGPRWDRLCRFVAVCKSLDPQTPSPSLEPLDQIAHQLTRIADTLERLAPPPISTAVPTKKLKKRQ